MQRNRSLFFSGKPYTRKGESDMVLKKSCLHIEKHSVSLSLGSREMGSILKFFRSKILQKIRKKQATSASAAPFVDCLKIHLWRNNKFCTRWLGCWFFLTFYIRAPFLNEKNECFLLRQPSWNFTARKFKKRNNFFSSRWHFKYKERHLESLINQMKKNSEWAVQTLYWKEEIVSLSTSHSEIRRSTNKANEQNMKEVLKGRVMRAMLQE